MLHNNPFLWTRICSRSLFLTFLLLLLLGVRSIVQADINAAVDPSIQYQTFEGWGISLAWWANVVGGFPEPARSKYISMAFDPINGLGLNIVRYNIGGGENPLHLAPNQQFLSFRAAVPGYEPAPGQWDWTADANQRYVLQQAINKGANQLEAFSNSPPYWMTISGSVTGNNGAAANLKSDSYDVFADYLTTVVKHFHDYWGITFRDVEPLNEPSGGWSYGNYQEGCHFNLPGENAIVNATGDAAKRLHLRTTITASDEPSIGNGDRAFGAYDATALDDISKINVHSYGGGDRTRLMELALSAGKDRWLSEYGDNDRSGIATSERILEDMNGLHPTAWVGWQFVDSAPGWGCLRNPLDNEADTDFVINQKYYVMENYTRFIRPGDKLICVNDANSLCAFNDRSRKLVIVVTNNSDAESSAMYDLTRFDKINPSLSAYQTSASENLTKLPPLTMSAGKFHADLPPQSVTTFVLSGAHYRGMSGFDYSKFYSFVNDSTNKLAAPSENTVDKASAQWSLLGVGDGFYKIINRSSGLVLGDAPLLSGQVSLSADKNSPNQMWLLEKKDDGAYEFINKDTQMALTAGDSGLAESQPAQKAAEIWRLVPANKS